MWEVWASDNYVRTIYDERVKRYYEQQGYRIICIEEEAVEG